MDILAGWRKSGEVDGDVLVDNVPRNDSFKLIAGYVPQVSISFFVFG